MPDEPSTRSTSRLRMLGRALAHRNYRLYYAGQGISLIGTWMTRLATGWLVFRLSGPDSAFLLGVVGFVGQVPTFFLAPLAGALVDHWNRHRTLVVTQALAMLQSALLAAAAFTDQPASHVIAEVMALSLFQGFINAFDMPARQAFLVEMVERKEDLGNAIALNSSLVNGASLVGPSAAGLLIAVAGEGWCFLVDAVSYVAVIAALLAMRVTPRQERPRRRAVWGSIVEGFRYAFGFPPIRSILLLLTLVGFMGLPYRVLLPIFAAEVLQGGPKTLGFLTGAAGIGALTGAVYLASRTTVLGLGTRLSVAAVVFGMGLVGLGLSHIWWVSLPLMLLIGFGMMVQMAASNTILQTIVEEDKRGRVMSFYSMALMGTMPFGSLFLGALASWLDASRAVMVGGASCCVGAILFAYGLPRLRDHVRPIYARLGIVPEVATGIEAAAELSRPPEA